MIINKNKQNNDIKHIYFYLYISILRVLLLYFFIFKFPVQPDDAVDDRGVVGEGPSPGPEQVNLLHKNKH